MSKARCYTWIRRILCSLNVFFWAIGCVLVSIGIWLSVSEYSINQNEHTHWFTAKGILLMIGFVTLVTALFGWLGALCSSRCLLHTYLLLLLLLMTAELLLGSVILVQRHVITQRISAEMMHSIKHEYGRKQPDAVGAAWRLLQKSMKCCGHQSHRDWYHIDAWPSQRLLPGSCCQTPRNYNVQYVRDFNSTGPATELSWSDLSVVSPAPLVASRTCLVIHQTGCYNQLVSWLQSKVPIIALFATLVAILQFATFACAIYLLTTLRFRYDLHMSNSQKPVYDRVRCYE